MRCYFIRWYSLVHYRFGLSEVGDGNVAADFDSGRSCDGRKDGGGSYTLLYEAPRIRLADVWRIRMIRGDMWDCICNPLGRHCYSPSQTVTPVCQTSHHEELHLVNTPLHDLTVSAVGLDSTMLRNNHK